MKGAIILACGIYKFENLINHMVYIGQAIDLEARYNKHYKNINDNYHQEDLYKAFREFGFSNFSYEILEEFENFDQEKLNQLECYYIEKFDSIKPNGYNMIPGGTNGAGLAKGKAVCQYDLQGNFIAEYPSAHQADYATGINYSSICACCRNEITHTKNFQWKYLNSDKQITNITNQKIIVVDKKVYQYNLNKQLINKYNNLKEASEQTNISKSIICKVCNGKGHTAGGFIWRYEDNPLESDECIKTKKRAILQYDKHGNFIKEYDSITEAAKQTNTNQGNIQSVCNHKRKSANNYIWKYKD